LGFEATAGGSEPASQALTIFNAGSGTLAPPTVAVTHASGDGWLAATVAGIADPYTLTVTATLGSLGPGTHDATIAIASTGAANSPVEVPVTFTVHAPPPPPPPAPTIVVVPSSLDFAAWAGGGNPGSRQLSVASGDGGALAVPTAAVEYTDGSGWLTASVASGSAPYAIWVAVSSGSLPVGTYRATVSVDCAGAANSPVRVPVTLSVATPVPTPVIVVRPTTLSFTAVSAGTDPAAQDLAVTSGAANPIAAPTATVRYSTGAGWLSAAVLGSSEPFIVRVAAFIGTLAAGTHQATVAVASTGASNSPVLVPVTFTVLPPAATGSIVAASSTYQTGQAGQPVADPPAVRVRNATGTPVAGTAVTFEVVTGAGSLVGANATTGADGIARVASWTLGASGPQRVQASATGLSGSPVSFDAVIGGGAYSITLRYLTTPTASQTQAFEAARARIEQLVVGDLPDVPLSIMNPCGGGPAINETVDDLLVLVRIASIDGPGNVLGQAGPCVLRGGSHLPVLGSMEFDSADVAQMETSGQFPSVVLHEMLHVVGFGAIWDQMSPSLLVGAGTADPIFVGANAVDAFLNYNNGGVYPGAPVPVEATGGPGTRDSHWREKDVFKNELMTGWISGTTQPLSRTTAGSLLDLGYQVQLSAADPFDLATAALRAEADAPGLSLGDDVLRMPLHEVDASGTLRPLP
jgi:hypothetical protein